MATPFYQAWVGIDIAAKTFTATWTPQEPTRPHTFDQSGTDYQRLTTQLQAVVPNPAAVLVVMGFDPASP